MEEASVRPTGRVRRVRPVRVEAPVFDAEFLEVRNERHRYLPYDATRSRLRSPPEVAEGRVSRYAITDITSTILGEGDHAGRRAVVVGFSDCNLWSGNGLQRDQGMACAAWCHASFERGTPMAIDDLIAKMGEAWPTPGKRVCLLTGGEPAMQLDKLLVVGLHEYGWTVLVETNGNIPNEAIDMCDHVIVSPKRGVGYHAPKRAKEVRVVLPGGIPSWRDEELRALELDVMSRWPCARLYVVPQDPIVDGRLVGETALRHSDELEAEQQAALEAAWRIHLKRCVSFVMANPSWTLAAPVHKFLGLE